MSQEVVVNEELFVFKLFKKYIACVIRERERESESGGSGQRRDLCVQMLE